MGWKRYFTLLIILFLNTLAMTLLIFRIKESFLVEFFLTVLFLITAIIILTGIYHNKNWAWKLASIYFLVYLINAFYLYIFALNLSSRFSLTTLLSALGFLIATISIKQEETEEEIEIEPPKEPIVMPYGDKETVKTEFKPGKYLASKTGAVYHILKCDWAKRINRKNRVWLEDKEEAKNKGYNKHSCVD